MRHMAKGPHKLSASKPTYISGLLIMKVLVLGILQLYTVEYAHSKSIHGIAMHGQLKHKSDFAHFSYVNPKAIQGGRLKTAYVGTFDSLNPLIPKGVVVPFIRTYVYESLLARAFDEPFSLYGLLAEKVEVSDDRSWISFTINKSAKFSDGKPLTVDDVIFSHALLRDKGRPNHRTYYSKVTKVEKIGTDTVKFTFNNDGDREMPLIMGLMPVLPKHLITEENFEKTTLESPVGSGPYIVNRIVAGKQILFKKNPDYWAKDLAVTKGHFNFNEIQIDYYRDNDALFEAFKKGLYDVRFERNPAKWALSYNFTAIKKKQVLKNEVSLSIPSGMDSLVFNTRRKIFKDKRVRQALSYVFDFQWINKTLFHNLYQRTQSFFDRSELSYVGKAADDYERKLLAPYPDAIEPKILDGTFRQAVSDGTGRNRKNRRLALRLLKEAGYILKSGKLVNKETGEPFTFEVLIANRSQERLMLTYARALKTIGIDIRLRQVDSAQYEARKRSFDFDMIQNRWSASLSPGNEQTFRWSVKSADTEGTYNFPGVKSPAVDAMIKAMLEAKSRENFVSAIRALDRVLLSGFYVIPLYHAPGQWVAQWKHLKCPEKTSLYGHRIDTCWIEQ